MKDYEIWLGLYHLGQGYLPSTEPVLIDTVKAPTFKVACLLHELRSKLHAIEDQIRQGKYIDEQSCQWFYNYYENRNSWTGKYYESEEEAWKSFSNLKG